MSIVALYMDNIKAIIMGDTKLNDNLLQNTIRKVFKINDTLLGFTGNLQDLRTLYDFIFKNNMEIKDELYTKTGEEIIKLIDEKFKAAQKENSKTIDAVIVVCTQIDSHFVSYRYYINKGVYHKETSSSSNGNILIVLGNEKHQNTFYQQLSSSSDLEFSNIITSFQYTISLGCHFDKTINSIANFEFLYKRKVD